MAFTAADSVVVDAAYPVFPQKSFLANAVQAELKKDALAWFQQTVEEEQAAQESWEGDCELSLQFFPTYYSSNLLSVFVEEGRIRGDRGGCSYGGRTFWRKQGVVIEVELHNLFLQEKKPLEFIAEYCENNLRKSKYGYYYYDDYDPPALSPFAISTFVVTAQGIMIVFSPYTVGGWADGPHVLTIPFADLHDLIDGSGPLGEFLHK
jgi:hypothetical protein